jgi:hypothetical protein
MIYVDIRAGIPPAERTPALLNHLEDTWATLESCWKQDPQDRPDAVQLRAWLEVEIRRPQMHDSTPAASVIGAQSCLPSVDIKGKGDQEDPASPTVSGTSKPELASPLEPKSRFRSFSDPGCSTTTAKGDTHLSRSGTRPN